MKILKILSFYAIINAARTTRTPVSRSGRMSNDHGESQTSRVKRKLPAGYNIELYCEKNGPMYANIVTGSHFIKTDGGLDVGAQRFKLLLDTGSLPTWITGIRNNKDSFSHYIPLSKAEFDRNSNRELSFRIQYTDGSWAAGQYYKDTVCVDKFLCASDQFIGVTDNGATARNGNIDGVFGLANFKDTTEFRRASPFDFNEYLTKYSILQNIIDENKLTGIMSLWLHREGGILTIGGINEKLFIGHIYWITVQKNPRKYWQLMGMHLASHGETIGFEKAILNSGVEEILAPHNFVHDVYTLVEANKKGYFECDKMEKLHDLEFEFEGYAVNMEPVDYVIRERKSSRPDCCRLGIKTSNSQGIWHLGVSFMRKRYIIFSFNQLKVGFATPIVPSLDDILLGIGLNNG